MSTIGIDTFVRANQSGWGTSSGGQVWNVLRGTSTFAISGNTGTVVNNSGPYCVSRCGSGTTADFDETITVTRSDLSDVIGPAARIVDANNWYACNVGEFTSNLVISKFVAGSYTDLAFGSSATYATATAWDIRFKGTGTSLQAKIWDHSTAEPGSWTATVTDSSLTSGGVGVLVDPFSASPVTVSAFNATDGATGTQANKTLASRFNLAIQKVPALATRFYLAVQQPRTLTSRFNLAIQQVRAVSARFKLSIQQNRQVSSRFNLGIQQNRTVPARFLLSVQQLRNVATRFNLSVAQALVLSTRFRLSIQQSRTVSGRFNLAGQRNQTLSTRLNLGVQRSLSAPARFRLAAGMRNQTLQTRLNLGISAARACQARFNLALSAGTAMEPPFVVGATFRDGRIGATFRDGTVEGTFRSGLIEVGGR